MPNRGSFDPAGHNPDRWHTYPKGHGMRRLDAPDVVWWTDAGAAVSTTTGGAAEDRNLQSGGPRIGESSVVRHLESLAGLEIPNLAAAGVGLNGVTSGGSFFGAAAVDERSAVLLDGISDSISFGASPYTEGYFDFRAAADQSLVVDHLDTFNLTGDLTLLAKLSMADWTPGSTQTIFARWVLLDESEEPAVPKKVVMLRIDGSSRLIYNWSADGNVEFQAVSTAIPPPTGDLWVAVTHDVNNGAGGNTVRFLTSTSLAEPAVMTLLNTVTTPGALTSFYMSTNTPIRVGSRENNQERIYARIKTVILRGSISGASIGLTNEVFRIDADAIVDESASTVPLGTPTGEVATVTGTLLKRPIGGGACFGPGESSTIILCGLVGSTQSSGARLFDSQPASLMGGQAVHVTGTSGAALTARVARAGVGAEVTVVETAITNAPEVIILYVDRQSEVMRLVTDSGGETVTAINPLLGSSQRYADIRIGSSNENSQYAQFDFYAGAIVRKVLDQDEEDLITTMFLDASDRYDDGDYWTVTAPGIFDGVFYAPGDQVLATGTQSMQFDEVNWGRVPAEAVIVPAFIPVEATYFGLVEMNGPPSVIEASFFDDPVVFPYRRLDIYEPDGTLWRENCPLISGSVSIDYGRDERRSGDCEIWLPDANIGPGGLWYDKVFRLYRGLTFSKYHRDANYAQATLVWQIGSFMADRITEGSESANFRITFRDLSKRMMLSKLTEAITFPEGTEIAVVIRALAANSGILDMLVPATGKQIGKDFTFETGASRWEISKKIANDFGYELFFDHRGWLIMRTFIDPLTAPIYLHLVAKRSGLGTNGQQSNVGSYERTTSDERIYNHVAVIAEGTDRTTVYRAEAENTLSTSPTSIARIGRRTMTYTSNFITTQAQAKETADALLAINGLEQFTINVGSTVYPWIEVGTTIQFEDDDVNDNFPSRYLLLSASIPLGLDAMSLTGSRVTIIGSEPS
jgi:hypothetical protein